jgi:hypothetical protein
MLILEVILDSSEPVKLCLESDKAKNLEFSRCGRSIVLWTVSSKLPIVEPIPRDILNLDPSQDIAVTSSVLAGTSDKVTSTILLSSMSSFSTLPIGKNMGEMLKFDMVSDTSPIQPLNNIDLPTISTTQQLSRITFTDGLDYVMHHYNRRDLNSGPRNLYPTSMIQGNHTTTHGDGSSSGIVSDFSTDRITLRTWSNAGGVLEEMAVELSRLPTWQSLSSASASVKLPQDLEDFVQVVLNKKAEVWCSFSNSNDIHLPAVVLRERGSLRSPSRVLQEVQPDMDATTSLVRVTKSATTAIQACPFETGHEYRSLHGR